MELFESIKHINPKSGVEYWFARELQPILEYIEWCNFTAVIVKAKDACNGSGINDSEHFVDVNKSYNLGAGSLRTCFN
jgi:DNA-damage-inducible protein D